MKKALKIALFSVLGLLVVAGVWRVSLDGVWFADKGSHVV